MKTKSLFPELVEQRRKPPKVPENTIPYRPHSAWEKDCFVTNNCNFCYNFVSKKCKFCPCADCKYDLIARTEAHEITSKEYPKWWVSDIDGNNPRCLLIKKPGAILQGA
jgi:hypothetical protein